MSKNVTCFFISLLPAELFIIGLPAYLWRECSNLISWAVTTSTCRPLLIDEYTYKNIDTVRSVWSNHFYRHILPVLREHRKAVIHAPTGSGKSAILAKLLLEEYAQVFYIEPRVAAAQWMLDFEFINNEVSWPVNAGAYSITGGHFLNRLLRNDVNCSERTIFVFDEYDERDPPSLVAAKLLGDRLVVEILLSATSDRWTQERLGFPLNCIVHVPVSPRYRVESFVARAGTSIMQNILVARQQVRKILVIVTGLQEAKTIHEQLDTLDISAGVLASGMRIPDCDVIVATQVAEKSVTFPDLECVIDCGRMMRNHRGRIQVMPNDAATSEQRRGRVGRVRPGLYITMQAPSTAKNLPYPSGNLLCHYNQEIEDLYGLDLRLSIVDADLNESRVNPYCVISLLDLPAHWRRGNMSRLLGSLLLVGEGPEGAKTIINELGTPSCDRNAEWIMAEFPEAVKDVIRHPHIYKENLDQIAARHPLRFVILGKHEIGDCLRLVEYNLWTDSKTQFLNRDTLLPLTFIPAGVIRPPEAGLPPNMYLAESDVASQVGLGDWQNHLAAFLAYYTWPMYFLNNIHDCEETLETWRSLITTAREMYAIPARSDYYMETANLHHTMKWVTASLECEVLLRDLRSGLLVNSRHKIDGRVVLRTIHMVITRSNQLWIVRDGTIKPVINATLYKHADQWTDLPEFAGPDSIVATPEQEVVPYPVRAVNRKLPNAANECAYNAVTQLLYEVYCEGERRQIKVAEDLYQWSALDIREIVRNDLLPLKRLVVNYFPRPPGNFDPIEASELLTRILTYRTGLDYQGALGSPLTALVERHDKIYERVSHVEVVCYDRLLTAITDDITFITLPDIIIVMCHNAPAAEEFVAKERFPIHLKDAKGRLAYNPIGLLIRPPGHFTFSAYNGSSWTNYDDRQVHSDYVGRGQVMVVVLARVIEAAPTEKYEELVNFILDSWTWMDQWKVTREGPPRPFSIYMYIYICSGAQRRSTP